MTLYRALREGPGRRGRPLAIEPGFQQPTIHGARMFVLPNPSGRNANFSYEEMLAAFRALRRAIDGDQCAAIGPPPRGRFISSTSGSSSRKITPSSRKSPTNDTIDACCCTIPNSAA